MHKESNFENFHGGEFALVMIHKPFPYIHGRSQHFGSGGGTPLGVGLVGVRGPENFRKFSKNLTNHALIFLAFARKTQFFEKFLKIFDENLIENLIF